MKRILVAPTNQMARRYLMEKGERISDWVVIGLDEDFTWAQKLRGRQGGTGEIIDSAQYCNADRRLEFKREIEHRQIKLTPVSY